MRIHPERPRRRQTLQRGPAVTDVASNRKGIKLLREGGKRGVSPCTSDYSHFKLTQAEGFIGGTAQSCTDKAVQRHGFERRLIRGTDSIVYSQLWGTVRVMWPNSVSLKTWLCEGQTSWIQSSGKNVFCVFTHTHTPFPRLEGPRFTPATDNITSAAVRPNQPRSKTMGSLCLYIVTRFRSFI